MLERDLMLDQSLILFEDLNDLLRTLDEYIDLHNDALQRYGDRLGILLRLNKATSDQSLSNTLQQSKETAQKRKGSDKDPWSIYKLDQEGNVNLRIANTSIVSPATAENALLFRMIEALKSKVHSLEEARKVISELPTTGQRANQRFVVAFADGLPKQIIPTDQTYSAAGRFTFNEQFVLGLLDESQDLIQS